MLIKCIKEVIINDSGEDLKCFTKNKIYKAKKYNKRITATNDIGVKHYISGDYELDLNDNINLDEWFNEHFEVVEGKV